MRPQQPPAGRRAGSATSREVVAGMVNDDAAADVARTAVRLAAARDCGVRFVQVLTVHSHDDAGMATFGIALKALRGQPQVPVAFEVVSGHPGRTLVERSQGAAALVVGDDTAGASSGTARYCRTHAGCTVVVPAPRHEVAATRQEEQI